MSYQALYRVWRPQRFDEIIGQELITKTLKNALITKQTSHAYLFAGPRGTGKTSAAKIFAKAVNCRFLKDGEPCNECDTCKAITAGTLNDVIEIDAASNNGVEEIRDIRDKAKYTPTEADYKVYIIDEVHMLSTGAFNALLKTLEEPPANVIFILATTEPHKIPATIISRTQRFDFRRIKASDSFNRMKYILDEKGVTYDEQALKVIAKAAEGGMRDALSILDQALSFGDNEITLENALLVTGSVEKGLLTTYLEQVVGNQTTDALITLQKVLEEGKDAHRFIEDVLDYLRNLLLYQQAPDIVAENSLGDVPEEIKTFSSQLTASDLFQAINILNGIQSQMRLTNHPDIYLEVLTIQLAQIKGGTPVTAATQKPEAATVSAAPTSEELASLSEQVAQLKQQVKELKLVKTTGEPAPSVAKTVEKPKKPAGRESRVNLAKVYPVLDTAARNELAQIQQVWSDLMQILSVTQRAVMHVAEPVAASKDGLIVAFDYSFLFQKATLDSELLDALENGLDRLIGHSPTIVFVPKDQWPQIRKDYLVQHKDQLANNANQSDAPETGEPQEPSLSAEAPKAEPDPVVTKATDLFGTDIVDIKQD
ncbi:DNA polymerase III gamma/tau subunit [Secundilactobacillus oryzae JCM 18671]|uniref:DNA-directed DNA polymerase n=1 Tax=Secundilactobacillus oryzae JCM 18671 TaxID=1291743 RepID=A0A081BK03_9LACO|nr:DNA polymerase III subunit gamma/tau [Secundilactobacillus oryzae]GAK48371.1 DNA polymerase III gamma/tau subunit [Secundilactobacillus oryzae JCM 18671]